MDLGSIEELIGGRKVSVSTETMQAVADCYSFLEKFSEGKVVYGINTGFGPMAQYRIDDNHLNELQYNIIRSHSCGAGERIPDICVRAAMLSRMQTFLNAKSGVHPDVVKSLEAFINAGIYPIVPVHGSVGASGDLVQLSHIALALIGEGEVSYKGEKQPTAQVLKELGIEPLKLHIRDGLALTNGTAVMTGVGLVNVLNARKLLNLAVTAGVMINEVVSSYDDFMSEILNSLKLHSGQNKIAAEMRDIASSSTSLRHREDYLYKGNHDEPVFKNKVQPYYSLRCVPQILGPILETIENAEKILTEEFNSVDDNPIVDPSSENIYHGGNFHGDYVSFEMDKLKIAVTKLTVLAERQLNYLFHDRINGILPPFLNLGKLGLNYGMQAMQFTATSTTAECQTLANPMYVHSIPNNNDNQDVVSMGTNSAILARNVIENSFQVMSIEMIALTQAVDCLKIEDKLSEKTKRLYHEIRSLVPVFVEDTTKYGDIAVVEAFLKR